MLWINGLIAWIPMIFVWILLYKVPQIHDNIGLLWEFKLPAPAFATPAIYVVEGKQYLAIACGGEKLGTKKGNKIIAFALEQDVNEN